MTARHPTVSIVVASQNARTTIEECLSSIEAQLGDRDVEILVADNSIDGSAAIVEELFPDVTLLSLPPSALIPELWAAGIRATAGDIVCITTAHCVPDKEWLSEILRAHEGPVAAVGGAIENDEDAGLVDWAIYFCRYAHYMPPLREGVAAEIAGDNASYKRASLEGCRPVWSVGFWEPEVHAELRKAGLSLWLSPSVIVGHKRSFSLPGFVKQRFQHGMQYGRARARRLPGRARALYTVLIPAIPLVLLFRIARQVLGKRRYQSKLLWCLPVLVLFLLAWGAGELLGHLRARRT